MTASHLSHTEGGTREGRKSSLILLQPASSRARWGRTGHGPIPNDDDEGQGKPGSSSAAVGRDPGPSTTWEWASCLLEKAEERGRVWETSCLGLSRVH